MEYCKTCRQNARQTVTCIMVRVQLKGLDYQRIPYGKEIGMYQYLKTGRCPECHAIKGGYHHFGCDVESCPRCGERASLVKCGCLEANFH